MKLFSLPLCLSLFLLLGMGSSSSLHAEMFYKEKARGWYWYEVLPIPQPPKKEKDKDKDKDKKSSSVSVTSSPAEKMKSYRAELENRLTKAWVEPTAKNVKAYQEMQKDMMDRSQLFSEAWVRNVFQDSKLDYSLIAPVNQGAIHVKLDLEKKRTKQIIQNLSESYGLFFFYSSSCVYCHKFAPIVKSFADSYGWKVLAISLDGGKIEEFPQSIPDNGLGQQWNIQALPSLYAVNPKTEHVIQVAHGMTSIDEMESRILTLAEPQ